MARPKDALLFNANAMLDDPNSITTDEKVNAPKHPSSLHVFILHLKILLLLLKRMAMC